MAKGRCAGVGCGFEGSLKAAESHIMRCPAWVELYRLDPDRALVPAEEFQRVEAERAVSAPAVKPDPPRVSRPKVSDPVVRVASVPVVEARIPGPVSVEYWRVPQSL